MHNGILLLTLRVFSATGGIEKVCKVLCATFKDIYKGSTSRQFSVFSMYDTASDLDCKYINPENFTGFNENKISFVKSAIKTGRKSKVVILSHINLLSIGYLIKLCSPKTRLVLFAHGIEIWEPLPLLRRIMLRKCDLLLAVSNFTKEKIVSIHKIPAERVTVVNNCLDPFLPVPVLTGKDETLLNRYQLKKSDFVLLTLSRLSSKELYKGYDNVLFALKELKIKFPNIKYLIIGNYDEEEKQRLDKIIDEQLLKPNVVFTGFIPDEELARHYSLADIYVMPSKKEGFGIVFIEAMHYHIPVIGGNKDGTSDALLNGVLGMQVNPDDKKELKDAIEKVVINREKYLPDANLLEQHFGYPIYRNKIQSVIENLFA